MVDRSDDASCLLGLDGLAVERVVLTALGVRVVQLVTDDPDAARCPACRMVSTSGKDWVLTRPHDLPCGGGQVAVQWRKRRWRCRTAVCPRAVVHRAGRPGAGRDAHHDPAAGGARGGGRGRPGPVRGRRGARGVVADGAARGGRHAARSSWSSPSRFGCWGWTRPGSGGRGGCLTGRHDDGRIRWRRTDPWETGFVDITGDQALLGQVDGRTSAAVQAWLAARTEAFRAGVEVVVIDPHAGYAAAVRAALPDAGSRWTTST